MKNVNIATVVLSGGVGSRLWPLSRKNMPKQYLKLFDNKSLFQLAVERNIGFSDRFIIVGNQDNYQLSEKELLGLGVDYQTIVEAMPKNTAAAIAFAALSCNPDEVMLVVPSDHIIENIQNYQTSVKRAVELALENQIVTFGISPTKPETGYGYIECEGERVVSFREKPDKDTAQSFLKQGNFCWNSGMFCFKASVFLQELKKFEPEIYSAVKLAWQNAQNGILNKDDMQKIPSKSVDYAVMERTDKMKVVKGNFGWSDLGSFESLYEYFSRNGNTPDENGNMYIGSNKYSAFVGMKNTIVVETPDAVLILNKENSQDVKTIYESLEKQASSLI